MAIIVLINTLRACLRIYCTWILGFRPKTSSFWLPYQCHSSSSDCTRELFKDSNRSASLQIFCE